MYVPSHQKRQKMWINYFSNEPVSLTQGVWDVQITNCMKFSRIVCTIRPKKVETDRTRMNIRGNILDTEGTTKASTSDIMTMKLVINSVLGTPGDEKIHNGKALTCISKGICGLKEAGALANEKLQQHLSPHDYTKSKQNLGIWKHNTTKKNFALVIDDVDVKCLNKINADHLMQVLQESIKCR